MICLFAFLGLLNVPNYMQTFCYKPPKRNLSANLPYIEGLSLDIAPCIISVDLSFLFGKSHRMVEIDARNLDCTSLEFFLIINFHPSIDP
jgi:hypothetical protein